MQQYKAIRKDNNKEIKGYFWKSPKSEYNASFIIETYISGPPSRGCNAKMATRSVEILPETIKEI